MIRNKIQKRQRAYNSLNGFNYANRQARNMFMVTFAVFGVVLLLGALIAYSIVI